MAGIAQYTSFLNQQKEVMLNFRELIRMEKESLNLEIQNGKQITLASNTETTLQAATEHMDELKLFEYFVEVQLNAIECGARLTEKFKDKIQEIESRNAEEKASKAKEEAELRKAEKQQEKTQKAFELAKAKMERDSEANGEPIFETTDEELMAQVAIQAVQKQKTKADSKAKEEKTSTKTKEESLFDLFGE